MRRSRQRHLTIRLMIATALLMLTALVGALASLGGDSSTQAWGKALLSMPIFLALFFFGHLVWKADLPRLWDELTGWFALRLAEKPPTMEDIFKTLERSSVDTGGERAMSGDLSRDQVQGCKR